MKKTFTEYFKFPLKMWEDWDLKVFTSDNRMAFDWMINATRDIKQALLDVINGVSEAKQKTPKEFWHDAGIIYCKFLSGSNEDKVIKICRIRGWGMLTGTGGYHLDDETAAEIQDTFAEYCVDKLNGKNNE